MPISPARSAAFELLLRIHKTDAYGSELLHSPRFAKLSPADHALLTEIVMGVLRWRGTLDEAIAARSSQPLAKLDIEVLTALRIGLYQTLFLDRIPPHAAINDSVELVKRARKGSASGFVNALLRKIDKTKLDARNLPIYSSHPEWLVERWKKDYGDGAAEEICRYDQLPPAATVRVTDPSLVHELQAQGISLQKSSLLANSFRITGGYITGTTAFRERQLILQDEGSQLIALLLGSGNSILDCCAAPGGKTRIIAERNPQTEVIALELHPHRAALLRKLVPHENVRIIAGDARAVPLNRSFDRVLVDAPCSGTGTLTRNPEIKWRLKAEDLPRLHTYQVEILSAAMRQVAPGGRIIYSTCSLEPEENEQVVESALAGDPTFAVVDCGEELAKLQVAGELAWKDTESLLSGQYLRTIPGVHPCDGFFAAIIEKR